MSFAETGVLRAEVDSLKAELANLFPLLVDAEAKNARYAHELGLLVAERDRLETCVELTGAELRDARSELAELRADAAARALSERLGQAL